MNLWEFKHLVLDSYQSSSISFENFEDMNALTNFLEVSQPNQCNFNEIIPNEEKICWIGAEVDVIEYNPSKNLQKSPFISSFFPALQVITFHHLFASNVSDAFFVNIVAA